MNSVIFFLSVLSCPSKHRLPQSSYFGDDLSDERQTGLPFPGSATALLRMNQAVSQKVGCRSVDV
jgi:hypothetical protein